MKTQLPVIDLAPLARGGKDMQTVARAIRRACEETGFFYIVGHGVSETLQQRLLTMSRSFFALDLETKMRIHMNLGGRAWRGYFPVGEELTSGKADLKEGIYFGAELSDEDPLVRAGTPMHGSNLFPSLEGFRETILAYIDAMTSLGHSLMSAIALSLDLDASYFNVRYTAHPFILFRIFNYPPAAARPEAEWGVGEHTDYGLLTILLQDDTGGLEVKSASDWIEAPPIPGSFVCNIGDMLDRMTAGRYRSTLHRVRNLSTRDRLSFPFFFDPSFDAEVAPIFPASAPDDRDERWDGSKLEELSGTYGDYILGKIAKVFPQLRTQVL